MKNYFIHIPLFILSYLIPKKNSLILFGAGDAKQFQGNPKYMYQYLRYIHTKKIAYYWSAKSKSQREFLESIDAPYINPYSLNGFFKILRAKYLVIEKSSYDVYYIPIILGRFNFIQTWHGTPLKQIGIDRTTFENVEVKDTRMVRLLKKFKFFSRQKYKLILSPSEEIGNIFKRAFENPKVKLTGYPRNDVLYNSSLVVINYRNQLDLNQYKKILLYAPTFRDDNALLSPFSKDLASFNKMLKEKNYLLLIKKHPWQKSLSVPSHLSHIKDVSSIVDDIQELFPYIDVLVNDYSSTFFDFMLTKKPIVFYSYDLEEYLKNCRGMYFNYYQELPGPFASNEEELFQLLFSIEEWSKDEEYLKRYRKFLDRFNHYQDGKASQRVFELLFPDKML